MRLIPILRIFLALGTLFGIGYALLLPPMQAPDEFAHFYRAYGIAEGSCIAPRLTEVPLAIKKIAMAFPPSLEEERRIDSGYIFAFLHQPLDDARREGVTNEAIDVYSCVPYLPQVAGIEAGRVLGLSPAAIFYFSRFANLIAYLALVGLALWMLPGFQLPVLSVALTPMVLNQAASASWDGMVYAAAFFLFAYILKLAWDPGIGTLQPRHFAILGGAIVLAGVCKTDVWLAPLLVLVPASRFRSTREKWLVLAGVGLLALLVVGGWNYVNRDDMARWVDHLKERQVFVSDNFEFLLQHPWVYVVTCVRTWGVHGGDFAAGVIGRLGWLAVVLPAWCIWLYFALFGLVIVTERVPLARWRRVLCFGVGAVAIATVFVMIWCAETTRPQIDLVTQGIGLAPGIQGRYFIPFVLPILLAISFPLFRLERKWLLAIASVTIFTVNAVALSEIHRTYYLSGSVGPYENKLVRRAGPTPEDGKVFLVRGGKRHWVIFGSWLTRHGFRMEELVTLPPEQFKTIPEGKVIQDQ